jgi:hypothetical protein
MTHHIGSFVNFIINEKIANCMFGGNSTNEIIGQGDFLIKLNICNIIEVTNELHMLRIQENLNSQQNSAIMRAMK